VQRTTKWVAAGLATGVALAIAGGVGAGPASSQSGPFPWQSGDDDQELTGSTRDQAVAAALKATGGGTVTDTETGDDGAAYGVEVLLSGGREVEVNLDRNLSVIGQETDDDSGDDDELTGAIRDQVIAAALKATGGGTVTDTETGDDGAAYGVEVRLADGREVEVNLDRNLNVIGQEADD
jgi:uncharacterized membrane protein YkoI